MKPIPKLLSKTKLMRGYRCLKCIYLTIHQPHLEPPVTPELQALFDQGNTVGAAARTYFPGGALIDNVPWDFVGAMAKTRDYIARGETIIYEAAFEYMGCYARADIIQLSPDTKKWRIYEVKSTTKVKPEHIDDVGLQVWIMTKSGLPVEQINILHLNPECRYPDLSNLFKQEDVTADMRAHYLSVQPKVHEIMTTIGQPSVPDVDIGPYCLAPNECSFTKHCWGEKNIPTPSVFNLPGIRNRKWDLYYDGILELNDPRLDELTDMQAKVVQAHQTKERFIDSQGIHDALATWTFPLIFLDFETINPAIPRYDGCGPFHQVPFQYSVHTAEHLDAPITHKEFLHETPDDPRPSLIPALLADCEGTGSIVAYFGKFEADRINELATYAPEHSEALLKLVERIVDPLPIIRGHVYDNAFDGSFSLKKVAPALLGEVHRYDHMLVGNGGDAQRAFEELISPKTSPDRKKIIREAMIEYCKKDTLVMVELVKWLYHNRQSSL